MTPVFRFAPSPNGYLHLGHAYSALLNFAMARAAGGRFLLRIEDIDATRCRPHYEAAIYEDLAWLGLAWEEPVRRQSQHLDEYRAALDRLAADGLVYRAFESRAEIAQAVARREAQARARPGREGPGAAWPRDPDGAPLYPGRDAALPRPEQARRAAAGSLFAVRLDIEAARARTGPLVWSEGGRGPDGATGSIAAAPAAWGDVVLGRKETPTSYHLSVVVDDAAQGVTHVVRGQDLFCATSVHRLLQSLFGYAPPRYRHHRLVVDAAGRKLAKSSGATALRELRAQGVSPQNIRALLRAALRRGGAPPA